MDRVNRYPTGFLGLLDTKSIGRTPPEINDTVQPVMDMTRFYGASEGLTFAQETQNGVVPGITGQVAIMPIPDGETWMVYGQSSFWTYLGFPDRIRIVPSMFFNRVSQTAGDGVAGDFFPVGPDGYFGYNSFGVGDDQSNGYMFPQPLILNSGVTFTSVILQNSAGNNVNVRTAVIYQRLE